MSIKWNSSFKECIKHWKLAIKSEKNRPFFAQLSHFATILLDFTEPILWCILKFQILGFDCVSPPLAKSSIRGILPFDSVMHCDLLGSVISPNFQKKIPQKSIRPGWLNAIAFKSLFWKGCYQVTTSSQLFFSRLLTLTLDSYLPKILVHSILGYSLCYLFKAE